MSQAVAAAGPTNTRTTAEATSPVVLVNGIPDPELSVVSATFAGSLDERRATLAPSRLDDVKPDTEVTIAVPHMLTDGEVRWSVLLSGTFDQADCDRRAGTDDNLVLLRDRWSALLTEPVASLGSWQASEPTLESVLQQLGVLIGAELVRACDDALLDVPIDPSLPRTQPIALWLEPVFDELGVSLEQSLELQGRQVRRTLTLTPKHSGRSVALPWPDDAGRGGHITSVSVDRQAKPPRHWIARGDRPVVEDTFLLQPGWDASLQSQPDSDYGRLTSSSFSLYGPVYRVWVLNEDGAHEGDSYDAGALFDRPGSITSRLRFGRCLTRDSAERRLTPVIESSTDSGATWSAYPGQAEAMKDRAGAMLLDDVLPGAILSAAKAGTLRLRITATLTSPNPIEATRWDGNPFAGAGPTRVLNLGDAYTWRFVASTSIHRAAIDNGTLQADVADDRRALRARLQTHLAEQPGPEVQATIQIAGAWTALRVGDRVAEALGRGLAIDGNPSGFATRHARIKRIDLAFGVDTQSPRTRLRLD